MARERSNLVPDRTLFVGRDRERAALHEAWVAGARWITVVGPAGMGKTRLVRKVAAELEPPAGGTWFCDLTHAHTEAELLATVAGVLDVALRPGPGGGALQLARAIAGRGPLLLVLDNFETLPPTAAAVVERWIDEAPALRLLLTSQVRLGVEGEIAFELGPLDEADAVRLYEQRASAAWADRAPDEPETVGELVRRLDRIPLAIELAAARVRVLPPRDLLARLADRFAILQGPRRGRHTSLREAIACSFDLLSPEEKEALRHASVFVGGFSLEAAEAVIDAETPVLDLLEGLRNKSILRLEPGEPARFMLYESLRAFAAGALDETGTRAAVELRHARHFLEAAERWAEAIPGPQGPEAARRLLTERGNLLVAHGRCLDERPELAVRIGLALGEVMPLQGPAESEAVLFEQCVQAARRVGASGLLARALLARAACAARHGRVSEARRDLDEAARLAAGDLVLEGHVWTEAGRLASLVADFDGARRFLGKAVARFAALEHGSWWEGRACNVLGTVEERSGRTAQAAAHFERALALFRRCGNVRFQGIALLNLGVIRGAEGRLDEARAFFADARALLERAGDRASAADAVVDLASIELTAGRLDEAQGHLEQGLELERQLGNPRFEGLALGNLGLVALERRELDLAWARLRDALERFRTCEERHFEAVFLPFFAATRAALGQREAAAEDFAAARERFAANDDRGGLATVDLLEAFDDLAAAGEAPTQQAAALLVERAALRLRRAEAEPVASAELVLARRLVAAALARMDSAAENDASGTALEVHPEADWFAAPGGARVDLRRRGPLKRMLQGLVEQRLLAPGVGLGPEALFELGWPGDAALAINRVYTGVRALRAMGLEELLQRRADGYLLDPALPVRRVRG